MKDDKENKILLGTGILNWDRGERVSDRYGTVKLFAFLGQEDTCAFNTELQGQNGQLVAKVLKTRHSDHIGDLFRGVFPETPEVGEEIVLGRGELFFERDAVGLRPDDGRESLWLDIRKLYRAHLQTVELFFIYD
ncbi:MAG: hypothetical protein V1867_06785 [Candidatus Falkowbacteria bacterium]